MGRRQEGDWLFDKNAPDSRGNAGLVEEGNSVTRRKSGEQSTEKKQAVKFHHAKGPAGDGANRIHEA